jgi:type II secretory pathway predicted ATPase ExeA
MMKQNLITADLYLYQDFKTALASLQIAIQSKNPYVLILGDSGTGKTSLLRSLSQSLDKTRFQILYLSHGEPSPATFIRVMAAHLHLPIRNSKVETSQLLLQTLTHLPYRLLLWLDEAQSLSESTLTEIRLLAEAQLDNGHLFSVLFAALPSLKEKLLAPNLFPLWRRILPKILLRGLIQEEVKPFLESSFPKKEIDRISPEALSVLFEQCRGIPGILIPFTQNLFANFPSNPITKNHVSQFIEQNETL